MTGEAAQFDIVLLAAGQSRRFGKANKLLADIDGKPLVRRVAERLRTLEGARLIVVTGHEADAVAAAVAGLADEVIHNPSYPDGIAGSVAAGASAVRFGCAALIAQGDMPALSPELLYALAARFEKHGGKAIVFPRAPDGRQGTPVIWPADLLPELGQLRGDAGAKPLITRHLDRIAPVDIDDEKLLIDIDTVEALEAWRRR